MIPAACGGSPNLAARSAPKQQNLSHDLILITWSAISRERCAPGALGAQRHQ